MTNKRYGTDSALDQKISVLFNFTITLSLLRLPWWIVVFSIIVAIESLILYHYLKNVQMSVLFILIGNVVSSLLSLPLLLLSLNGVTDTYLEEEAGVWVVGGTEYFSQWLIPVMWSYSFLKNLPVGYNFNPSSEMLFFLICFIIAFIISFFIEFTVIKKLLDYQSEVETTKKDLFKGVLFANIASYSLIIVSLLGLGLVIAILSIQDPINFLSGWLFTPVHSGGFLSTLNQLLACLMMVSIIPIAVFVFREYQNAFKKGTKEVENLTTTDSAPKETI